MSVNCTSLGKRISFYRSKSNLSQEALAAKINCSREHIVRIENGTKIPSISVLVEIANTLSVSADELLLDCLEHSSSSANSEFHRLLTIASWVPSVMYCCPFGTTRMIFLPEINL